jgi:Enoyl-[acyl-carrier-protein] reductase (NADH)
MPFPQWWRQSVAWRASERRDIEVSETHRKSNNVALTGKKGLVIGIANKDSIAYGCAKAFRAEGADLAVSYLNAKAEPYVRPLAEGLDAAIIEPLDVRVPGQMEALFARVQKDWGRLDFLLHAIAFAPKEDLHGRVVDSSWEGFAQAMDISCHSFVRMAKLAEPLMDKGGAMLTMSYIGAAKAMRDYGMMGAVKSTLESCVRYMALELGEKAIRVNAISPGPIRTRAAGGLKNFDRAVETAEANAPLPLATADDVGALAAFLASDGARAITGQTCYVDGGFSIVG